jgi:hypothetical protein
MCDICGDDGMDVYIVDVVGVNDTFLTLSF